MDNDLRVGIWNVLTEFYWEPISGIPPVTPDAQIEILLKRLVADYFKQRIDETGYLSGKFRNVEEYFFGCEWNEVYDIIEFIARNDPYSPLHAHQFMDSCNAIFERELSAYRFVGATITQVTAKEEISEIEQALVAPVTPINVHLKAALALLSDRKSPDYRNSIKESISAVEAICRLIAKDDATLGKALKKVGEKVPLHPALEGAFSKLYGYTSSAEGIRHSLMEQSDLDFADAKFMLVSCSAFVNYLVYKSSKAGMKLNSET
jgi:hypothetical protein